MKRTAAGVDVAAVRIDADADDVAAERRKQFRAEFVGGAIGAIEDDAKTLEGCARDGPAAEEIEILMVERIVGFEIV